jgi:hypothetical protein
LLRLLEDKQWQAVLRQKMISYIQEVPSEHFNHLDADTDFYQRFAFKSLQATAQSIIDDFKLPFEIKEVYFPWNRTF